MKEVFFLVKTFDLFKISFGYICKLQTMYCQNFGSVQYKLIHA